MCILLKLHYAKFCDTNFFLQKLSKKNFWGVGSTPPPVKEGLTINEYRRGFTEWLQMMNANQRIMLKDSEIL